MATDDLHIERTIDLDQPVEDAWPLIATADGWQQWLVDTAAIEFAEGGAGEIRDDDVVRRVQVTRIDEQQSLTFRWWEGDDPSSASEVRIDVHGLPGGGSRVHVVERPLRTGATLSARSSLSVWEVRACLLALAACVAIVVRA